MKRVLHFNLNNLSHKAERAILSKKRKQNKFQFNVLVLSFLIAVLPFSRLFSNKLTVSLVSAGSGVVTFDLSWKNSWRQPSPVTAANWDAAWVFIKWRDCTASTNQQFTHGLISTATSDHNFNVSSGGTTFEPTLSDGSA